MSHFENKYKNNNILKYYKRYNQRFTLIIIAIEKAD